MNVAGDRRGGVESHFRQFGKTVKERKRSKVIHRYFQSLDNELEMGFCSKNVTEGKEVGPAGELNIGEEDENAARMELAAGKSEAE